MAITPHVARILVVEDEPKIAEILLRSLADAGYHCVFARTGEQALLELDRGCFDLCVLDLMLPGVNGLEVLRSVRQRSLIPSVIVLSACDSPEDRLLGLESGADDYVVKPYSIAEVLARIRILLSRSHLSSKSTLEVGDLRIDCKSRQVTRGARRIDLTPREYDILECLMRNHDSVVTRNMLARDVLRATRRTGSIDNVIAVHIAHLRRKLNGAGEIPLIRILRGVGFTIRESAERSAAE